MKKRPFTMRCANCGTEFAPSGPLEFRSEHDEWGYVCPVCQYHVSSSAKSESQSTMTVAQVETELRALLAKARAGGLTDRELVAVIRDELEFVAELAHSGRRLSVQIIDLGDQYTEVTGTALPDRRELLQTRVIGS
jgi:hypothetical protein